jgi:hypothetical protein
VNVVVVFSELTPQRVTLKPNLFLLVEPDVGRYVRVFDPLSWSKNSTTTSIFQRKRWCVYVYYSTFGAWQRIKNTDISPDIGLYKKKQIGLQRYSLGCEFREDDENVHKLDGGNSITLVKKDNIKWICVCLEKTLHKKRNRKRSVNVKEAYDLTSYDLVTTTYDRTYWEEIECFSYVRWMWTSLTQNSNVSVQGDVWWDRQSKAKVWICIIIKYTSRSSFLVSVASCKAWHVVG